MVATAIGRYYTTAEGFGDNVDEITAMVKGLLASKCSMEIHSHTRTMCRLFDDLEQLDDSRPRS